MKSVQKFTYPAAANTLVCVHSQVAAAVLLLPATYDYIDLAFVMITVKKMIIFLKLH